MKPLRIVALLAIIAFVGIFPVGISPNNAINDMAVFTLIYALAVTGWNIFSGYTGYISIGHAVGRGRLRHPVGVYSTARAEVCVRCHHHRSDVHLSAPRI